MVGFETTYPSLLNYKSVDITFLKKNILFSKMCFV